MVFTPFRATWAASTTESYLYAGNLGKALTASDADARAHPADIAVQELHVDVLLNLGLSAQAEAWYRAVVEQHPSDPLAHYLLGRALLDAAAARVEYERALKLDPSCARAYMGIAAVHLAQGHDPEAQAAYARALELEPTLAEARLALVRILVTQGKNADALALAKAGLAKSPKEPGIYFTIAALEPSSARSMLEQAAAAVPEDPSVWAGLAEARLAAGDPNGAIAAARQALQINPTLLDAGRSLLFAQEIAAGRLDQDGYRALASARDLQAKDPVAARAAFDTLVAKYPAGSLPWLGRAQLRQQAGDRAGAIGDLRTALVKDPASVEAAAALGMILAAQGGSDSEARALLGTASAARPWDSGISLALAQVLRRLGRSADAVPLLADCWALHPYEAAVAIAYAQALIDTSQADAAYAVVRDAAARIPDPQLGVALVMAATASKRYEEAAQILDRLAASTHDPKLGELAARLRATAAAQ